MSTRSFGSLVSALGLVSFIAPSLASAQTLLNTLALVNTFLNAAIGLFITLAIVVFFYGLIKYLTKLGGEDAAKEGLSTMFWGVIAIFVMVSIWGIIRLLQNTLKVTSTDPVIPKGIQINAGGSF